jgi:hypothetical protein
METAHVERIEFSAGAAFRVYGIGLDFDGITRELGLTPDHRHRHGEFDPGKRPYAHDMWSLGSPLGKDRELELHLAWLAERLLNRKDYIISLTKNFKVDIYCWKNLFAEQANLVLSSKALRIFTELNLELQVSLLCLPNETSSDSNGGNVQSVEPHS